MLSNQRVLSHFQQEVRRHSTKKTPARPLVTSTRNGVNYDRNRFFVNPLVVTPSNSIKTSSPISISTCKRSIVTASSNITTVYATTATVNVDANAAITTSKANMIQRRNYHRYYQPSYNVSTTNKMLALTAACAGIVTFGAAVTDFSENHSNSSKVVFCELDGQEAQGSQKGLEEEEEDEKGDVTYTEGTGDVIEDDNGVQVPDAESGLDDGGVIEKMVEDNIDPYDNLPEEDEPTTCTICLINREGPCRPFWRKFEQCMKDNSSNDDDDETNKSQNDESNKGKSSIADMCDKYMIPWIGCIQNYSNTYTSISNDFFQKELVDEIEKSIDENEKVLLENIDVSSIIRIEKEWWNTNLNNEEEDGYVMVEKTKKAHENEVKDIVLVEGAARINLFDGDKPVEIAYVKDQDGKLLGYDQFNDFKKSLEKQQNEEENKEDSAPSSPIVGQCKFHVNPKSTKSIQIYALYRSLGNENDESLSDTSSSPTESDGPEETGPKEKHTLYISSPVVMNDLPKPRQGESLQSEIEQSN